MKARRTPRRLNAAVFEVFAHRSVRIWLIPLVGLFPKPCGPPASLSLFFFFFFSPPPSPPSFTARSNRTDNKSRPSYKNCSRDFHNYSSNRNSLPHVSTHLLPCFVKRERKERNKRLSRRKIRLTSVSKYSKYHPGAGRLFALGELSWFTLRRKRCRAIPRKSLMYS